jgi:hypothetical protein
MNVVFKVYWNNPIEMTTEAGTQQLTFEVPLGAIISNPSSGGGTASYPSFIGNADKVLTVNATEDDVEWTAAVTQVYVDTQDGLLQDQIDLKADAIAVSQSLDTKADAMATSQSLALKADLIGGLIPASQLPSYVDDVLNFPNLASFPVVGEDGKIYVAEDTNKTYRWSGSSYVESGGGGVALGETSSTAYRGDNGKIAYDHSLSQGNPHNTTTSEIIEGTNKYFTDLRGRNTVLSGLIKTNSSNVTNTDTVEIAVGKLAAKSEATTTNNWVPASTVGSAATGFDISLFEFAKIDGMLFCRGFVKINSNIAANTAVFTITNNDYKVVRPSVSATKNYSAILNLQQSANITVTLRFMVTGNSTDASSAASSIQAFEVATTAASSNEWFSASQNACFGKLVTP